MSVLLPEKMPSSLDNVVNNVLEKPTKEIGDILYDMLYFIFGSIHFYAEKRRIKHRFALDEFNKFYEEKHEVISEKHRGGHFIQIASADLENSKLEAEKITVNEMFSNIILSNTGVNEKKITRSLCSNIIKAIGQMNYLEACIFSKLTPKTVFPVCEIVVVDKNNKHHTAFTNLLCANGESLFHNGFENRVNAISSLENLGVIKITYNKHTTANKYLRYTENNDFKRFQEELNEYTVGIKPGILYTTRLGTRLWHVCCKNLYSQNINDVPLSFI